MTPVTNSCYLLESEVNPGYYLHMSVSEDRETIRVSDTGFTTEFTAQ